MLTALVFLTSSANKAGQGRMSGCLCGGGYLLSIEKHAAGALFLLGSPPSPRPVPPLQLANALPPVPDLRVRSQTFPYYATFIHSPHH
jgi:hypothetical protein